MDVQDLGAAAGRRTTACYAGRWRVLGLLSLAQFMLIVDVTVINVALPTIATDLELGPGGLTWVVTAYTLCFGSLLLLGGRAADALGRVRVLLAGLALFTAASLTSGLAVDGAMLIASRSAQGVGAALVSPAAMSLVTALFHGPERNKALGVWSAVGGTGSAVGVLLGGVFVSGPGWEWVFFINVPVGAAVLVALPLVLGPVRGHVGAAVAPGRLDLLGALTLTAAPGLLIYGLVQARDHGFSAVSAGVPLVAAVGAVAAFVLVERRVREPLVRLTLLARRPLAGGAAVMLTASGLLISGFFLSSFFLQQVLRYSAMKTGLAFLPVAVAIVLGAHLASSAVGRLGWRATATAGFVLAAGGAVLLRGLDRGTDAWTGVVPGFALLAFGLGAVFVTATTAAMSELEHRDMGLASGLVSTSHELGAALGVAVLAAIAGAGIEGGSDGAGVGGFQDAFTATAIIAAVAAVAGALLLPAGRPDPGQGGVMAH